MVKEKTRKGRERGEKKWERMDDFLNFWLDSCCNPCFPFIHLAFLLFQNLTSSFILSSEMRAKRKEKQKEWVRGKDFEAIVRHAIECVQEKRDLLTWRARGRKRKDRCWETVDRVKKRLIERERDKWRDRKKVIKGRTKRKGYGSNTIKNNELSR